MMTCYVATKHTDEPFRLECRVAWHLRRRHPIGWCKRKKRYGLVKKRVPAPGDAREMVLFLSERELGWWMERHGKAQG